MDKELEKTEVLQNKILDYKNEYAPTKNKLTKGEYQCINT